MRKIAFSICLSIISLSTAYAQSTVPFLLKAESGIFGSNYITRLDGSITLYVYTNLAAT